MLSPCEHEAERIQYWFGRDKESILPDLLKRSASFDLLLSRKCDPVKIPRIPSQVEHLGIYGYKMAQDTPQKKKLKKVEKSTVNLKTLQRQVVSRSDRAALHTHCCVSQKNAYLLAESDTPSDLASEGRIQNWQLKEHFFAFKKLKTFSKQKREGPKPHHIVPIHSSKSSNLKREDQEMWEEMIRAKENRLFHLGRVTKYLVD